MFTVDSKALVLADQVRRRVETGLEARLAQQALAERARRAFALGARNVNHRQF